jgi:hypothetical protein
MFYQNTFPKFLEAITIGPDPSFLEKNTTFCEFASGFPQEVELMYDWKSVKRSSNPINALRNFTKKFIVYAPDMDMQTINFFVKKVKNFPEYYSQTIIDEVGFAFDEVKNITNPVDLPPSLPNNTPIKADFIENNTSIHEDNSFLNKLAKLLAGCRAPCNYFKPRSSSIGTIADFGRALSDSASILGAAFEDALHAPVNIATDVVNKVKPAVRTEFFRLKILTQDLYKDGVKPFFSKEDRERVKDEINQGMTPDRKASRLPLTGDTDTYFHVSQSHSKVQSKIKEKIGDCYRDYDYGKRYSPYDPLMNVAYAKRKYMGVKNGNVKSLIDILGSLAPAQYVTENTFGNSLDCTRNDEFMKYDDGLTAPKYDTYDGPSKGSEAVITAGGGNTVNPAQAAGAVPQSGAGLENIPATGKEIHFGFGEVKLTMYGYILEDCPDTGSEMGLGNSDNMIVPLKTIAINPEAYTTYGIKKHDVLIITATDKAGNTFVERRQVGDSSASLGKLGQYKMVIDEYLPTKKGSKLANRTNQLKISIRIADTKQPAIKWNVQEASQHAPMFLSRNDWERAKKFAKKEGLQGNIAAKMRSGEYNSYTKWSENESLKTSYINNAGC